MKLAAFNELLLQNPERVVSKEVSPQNSELVQYTHADFLESVKATIRLFRDEPILAEANEVLLYCEDTYQFTVVFTALCFSKKNIVLPQNGSLGSLSEARSSVDAMLLDSELAKKAAESDVSEIVVPVLPKCMAKDLEHDHPTVESIANIDDSDSINVTVFTSGSSGKPKAIVKNIECYLSEVAVLESKWCDDAKDAEFVATVSHQHVYGLLFKCLWPLLSGRPVWSAQLHFPEEVYFVLGQISKAIFVSSPAFLSRVTDQAWRPEKAEVVLAVSSGGPLKEQDNFANQAIGKCPITEVLGSSETGGVATRTRLDASSPQRWTVLPRVEFKASDNGQLLVKSPFVFTDAWFEMGDRVGELDADGFTLAGRADRVAKIEEKRVSLDEVEQRLQQCDEVESCKTVLLSGKRQALGVVAVLTQEGELKLAENGKLQLTKDLRAKLSRYFEGVVLPRKWRFVDALEVNAQGKITVTSLEKLFEE